MATPFFPIGHYHSPVVEPDENVLAYVAREEAILPEDLFGIELDRDAMFALWKSQFSVIQTAEFGVKEALPSRRFHLSGPFPYGDALSLRIILAAYQPNRIIEIGSGFSTACMLDCADEFGLESLKITCIEPYPDRLLSLLHPGDMTRLTLRSEFVQNVPASIVEELEENDILFIDSTHVLKTGSDLHYELFHMLPRLKPGVIVHFHDCRYPFEYPLAWIKDRNYSWNETYALRAFLTFNSRFAILYWGSLFRRLYNREIIFHQPKMHGENPGSSLWIRVRYETLESESRFFGARNRKA